MGTVENSKRIKYLEEENNKLWEKVAHLEEESRTLKEELPQYVIELEREARQSSKKAAEYKNKAEKRLEHANKISEQIEAELDAIRTAKKEIFELSSDVNQEKILVEESRSEVERNSIEYQKQLDVLNSNIVKIDSILEKHPDLNSQISQIENFIKDVEDNHEKSELSLSNINKRKKEVDELYLKIFGYTQTDEESGEEIRVGGLKKELEDSYEDLSDKLEVSFKNIQEINSGFEKKYQDFQRKHLEKYDAITQEIEKLLPTALTAGLSAAFSQKKEDEVKSSKILQERFTRGIYSMIGVSLIPILLSLYFLIDGVEMVEVIERVPRIVLAMVPIYIPILWFTYSANKKLNLSKRLIEEYSHKEVLSKTYEGLSKQISNIIDKEQSEELKVRLLANFLQVSSENPGKLISNYEASDHPVMEALEQAYKFQGVIDRLENIPGMGNIARMIARHGNKKMDERRNKIERAFADKEREGLSSEEDEGTNSL